MKYQQIILSIVFIVALSMGVYGEDLLRQISALKKEISKVKSSPLNDTAATNVQLARLHLQIAMLYQQQDLSLHTGGDLQRQALKHFNLAINTSAEFITVPLILRNGMQINPLIIKVPAYYQRGMLLKMMGDAVGALDSYKCVLDIFARHPTLHTRYEKTLVYSSIADAYLLQGNLERTIEFYHLALSIAPCKTEYWYGLVNSLKEFLYTYKQAAQNIEAQSQTQTPLTTELIQQQVTSIYERQAQYMLLAVRLCHKQYVLVDNDSFLVVKDGGNVQSLRNMTISPYLTLDHQSFMHYYDRVFGQSQVPLAGLDRHINLYTEEDVMAWAHSTDIQEYASHGHLPAMPYVYDNIDQYRYATKESDVYYALSYVYDSMGQHAQAYTYIQYANRVEEELRRSRYGVEYNPSEQELSYNHSAGIFTEQFYVGVQIDPHGGDGTNSIEIDIIQDVVGSTQVKLTIEPIFIVGMMRSGSTLLESMLDSHSLCIGIGEESLFNANLKDFRDKLMVASRGSGDQTGSDDTGDKGMAMLNERRKIHKAMQQEIYAYRRKLTKLAYERINGQVHDILSSTQEGNPDGKLKVYIVDKMLFNYRNIGFIHLVYPESLILHIYRDPLDTMYSIYKHKFDELSLLWSLKWTHILHEYRLYAKYISHFSHVLGDDRITHIRYEDLVRNPETYLSDVLVKKLGVAFEDNVLEYYNMPRSVQTHSQSQVRQKLYQSSIGSWRKYSSQLESVVKLLRKDLAKLKKEGALSFDRGLTMNWKVEYNHPDYVTRS